MVLKLTERFGNGSLNCRLLDLDLIENSQFSFIGKSKSTRFNKDLSFIVQNALLKVILRAIVAILNGSLI